MSTSDELLGGIKHQTLTLKCEVDASPPAESFHWTFNSSGEQTELPARLHSSEVGIFGRFRSNNATSNAFAALLCTCVWHSSRLTYAHHLYVCVSFVLVWRFRCGADRIFAAELYAKFRSGLRNDFVLGPQRDWRTEGALRFPGHRCR